MVETFSRAGRRPTEAEVRGHQENGSASATVTPKAVARQGYRFALSLTHDPHRAEDLLQDAWIAVLKAGGPTNAAYLNTAIRTRLVDLRRRALVLSGNSTGTKTPMNQGLCIRRC